MKIINIFLVTLLLSCNSNLPKKPSDILEKSFKEQIKQGLLKEKENFDKDKNIYSNYYYHIAFNGPDNWETDKGTADHVIYRTYNRKYGISFSIVVIEYIDKNRKFKTSWDFYNNNKLEFEQKMKTELETLMNTKITNINFDKTFIKNKVSTKSTCSFKVKSLNNEYIYKSIMHQVYVDNLLFTFSLQLPVEVYKSDINFYDDLFNKITFLPNDKKIFDNIYK